MCRTMGMAIWNGENSSFCRLVHLKRMYLVELKFLETSQNFKYFIKIFLFVAFVAIVTTTASFLRWHLLSTFMVGFWHFLLFLPFAVVRMSKAVGENGCKRSLHSIKSIHPLMECYLSFQIWSELHFLSNLYLIL